jgi:hydroxyethylthiazole kinase-like uncharacterized protein yjeF
MALWTAADCVSRIAVPGPGSHKYSRGVLGVATGSRLFPGAAVLGVEAAYRTGVGMVRYLGDVWPADLVLRRRPETVTVPGRVQAWLIGSGADGRLASPVTLRRWRDALDSGLPVVVDAGALGVVGRPTGEARPWILTPHHRELAGILVAIHAGAGAGIDDAAANVAADPARWVREASERLGVIVLLKGSTTRVVSPGGRMVEVHSDCGWLATAGTGDVLAGILGALLATHPGAGLEDLSALAATAAFLHGSAARLASGGGPIAALDVAEHLPKAIAELLER